MWHGDFKRAARRVAEEIDLCRQERDQEELEYGDPYVDECDAAEMASWGNR